MDLDDMLNHYTEEYYGIATERLFATFNEFDFPPEAMIDFLVMTVANLCLFSATPMRDANDVSRMLSKLVKELMKDGYGPELIDRLEGRKQ